MAWEQDVYLLEQIFLQDPRDGEPQVIDEVCSADGYFIIFTSGESSRWKHRVYSEEV